MKLDYSRVQIRIAGKLFVPIKIVFQTSLLLIYQSVILKFDRRQFIAFGAEKIDHTFFAAEMSGANADK